MPKKDTENVEVTTASFPIPLKETWSSLRASKYFKNFSAYVNFVVTADVERRENLERMGVVERPPHNDQHPPE